mmetsp:Transcript_4178/g.6305  ORF Transcript_4178/g.6305 Transcript_4178/m.6305 type:complete len:219 (-) Transcript_4178:483-1139(-)
MSAALAPSVRKEEEAAVIVPCGLIKAGLSFEIFSSDISPRIPLSCEITSNLGAGVTLNTSHNLFCSVALAADKCERTANSSWAARLTPNLAARRSALWPIISLVENSAMAGNSRPKSSLVERPLNICLAIANGPFLDTFCMPINRLRNLRETRIGTSDIVSTPPTTTAPAWFDRINSIPVVAARFEEMQAIVTVCDGIVSGNPAPSMHSRAIFGVFAS